MANIMLKSFIQVQLTIREFLRREDGASAIEYGIIAGLIAVGIITSVDDIGEKLKIFFEGIAEDLETASPTPDP
ncbi:Flp family type IVb pilin [Oceanimonas doudoroffii]|nr:Flp family type IVb pilin [Oceanimonas doudoroffii]